MRDIALMAAVVGLGIGLGCATGEVGPIGPGGRANRFAIEGAGFTPEAVEVETRELDLDGGATGLRVLLQAVLPPGNDDAPRQLRLELDLDLDQLRSAPRTLRVARSTRVRSAEDGPAFSDDGIGALRGLRLRGPCVLDCRAVEGTQRFEGEMVLTYLDAARLEARLDLEFRGPTTAEPDARFRIDAYLDVPRPGR